MNALHPAPGVKKKLGEKNEHQTKKGDGYFRVALFAILFFLHSVRFDGLGGLDRYARLDRYFRCFSPLIDEITRSKSDENHA